MKVLPTARTRCSVLMAAFAAVSLASDLEAVSRALDPTKPLTQYSVDAWEGEDTLPQRSVTAIAQTPDGYLWLGTYAGLVRFDGLRFVTFTSAGAPGLPSPTIHALAVDPAGTLWIGTSYGLSRMANGQFEAMGVEQGLVADFVRVLHVDGRGRVWVGTNDGLSRLENGRFRNWTTSTGLPNGIVRALAEDALGRVYVGTNGGGVVRFEDDRPSLITQGTGLPSDSVFALLAARDGSLWVGTNGAGLARVRQGKVESFGIPHGLPHDVIWSLHEDSAGTLWVGTYGGGISRFEGSRFTSLDRRHGLPDNFVRALYSDREGSLWIGTYAGGLARLREGRFVVWGTREGLGASFARAVLEASDKSLWMGTTGGGLCQRTGSGIRCWDKKKGLADDVRALMEDVDGTLWVGTSGDGMFVRKGEGFEPVPFPEEIPTPSITAIAPDGTGGLWIGTNGAGLAHRSRNALWQMHRQSDGLGSDFVLSLLVTRDRRVWAGTDGGGLSSLFEDHIKTWRRRDGLAGDVIFSLYEDVDGALWAGTSGGLSRMKDGRVQSLTTKEGLAEDAVFGIVEDGRGYLWLSGNRGLTRVALANLEEVLGGTRRGLEIKTYGRSDGMRTSECTGIAQPAAFRGRDGRLFFPTTAGVVSIDPSRIHPSALAPPVVIEEVLADGERVRVARVPPGRRRWEFRYTAPTFLAAKSVRFRYKLEGFDADWVEAGTERTAHYTRLPPGSYVFRVTAANADGLWNETSAAVTVTLEPHLWETNLFWGIAALVVAAMGTSLWMLRVRQLRARQRELEAIVEDRTSALVAEKESSEGARRAAEASREEAELATRHKGELLSIAAHDLKTPLQVVVGYGELIALEENLERVRAHAARSVSAARRMIEIIERLLASEALAQGRIPLQAEPTDVSFVVRESAAALVERASAKLQRIELEAPAVALVHADPRLLRQIVDNLLDNAIKYSPQAGGIRVTVRPDGPHVRIEVRDEGPGLSANDYAHLFERFQRLSALPTGGESSTGLGLSIVKQLVGLHGGRVWAESEGLGRGSTFIVELDAQGAETEEPKTPVASPPPPSDEQVSRLLVLPTRQD
jgi:ligand-binding sensor domain-containing protein/signal transduction histidine kinase